MAAKFMSGTRLSSPLAGKEKPRCAGAGLKGFRGEVTILSVLSIARGVCPFRALDTHQTRGVDWGFASWFIDLG